MGCYDTVLVPCPKCGTKSEFQTKSGEAVADAQALAKKIVESGEWSTCLLALNDDMQWDQDIPADVAFFINNKDGTAKRAL